MDDTLLENYLNNGSSEQEKSASDEMENSGSDYSEDSKTGKNQGVARGEEDSRAGSTSSEHSQSFFVMKVGSGDTIVQSIEENVWAVRPNTFERLESASKVTHTSHQCTSEHAHARTHCVRAQRAKRETHF